LGITDVAVARPLQAAWSSAAAFTVGALLPLLAALASPSSPRILVVAAAALVALAVLGALGARLGGALITTAVVRITVLGALAMGITAGIGALVGTAVE
jgi:VIT1/CCC1 family predicted Fe2+/Mn2+ transporter